jgi:hypothetical protein
MRAVAFTVGCLLLIGVPGGHTVSPAFGASIQHKSPVRPLHVETGGFTLGRIGGKEKASLEAVLYPRGNYAQYWFQWGRSTRYGHVTRVLLDEGFGVFGAEEVTAIIGRVRPDMTYHYRVVARNRLGKVFGSDRIMRTHGPLESPSSAGQMSTLTVKSGTSG